MDNVINSYFSFVPIYIDFIEKYVSKANHSFIIIYIYILKKSINNEILILSELAENLNMLSSDVLKGINYWKEEGLLSYEKEDEKLKVTFFSVNINNKLEKIEHTKEIRENNVYEEDIIDKEVYEIKQLYSLAEKKLAKTLSYNEKKTLVELYKNYGMSIEILATLFTYCIEKGKANFKYIEKVAIDWYENGIDSIEKVEAYLNVYEEDFREILNAFGIKNRTAIKQEEDYMKKWIMEFKMPIEVVKYACSKTILSIGMPSFSYADAIIINLHKKNVKTLEEAKKIDDDYERQIELNKKKVGPYNQQSRNKFINYKQETFDHERLKKLQFELLKREMGE